jgi:hypothetical protein
MDPRKSQCGAERGSCVTRQAARPTRRGTSPGHWRRAACRAGDHRLTSAPRRLAAPAASSYTGTPCTGPMSPCPTTSPATAGWSSIASAVTRSRPNSRGHRRRRWLRHSIWQRQKRRLDLHRSTTAERAALAFRHCSSPALPAQRAHSPSHFSSHRQCHPMLGPQLSSSNSAFASFKPGVSVNQP